MKFGIFKNFGALNSKPIFEAFEESIIRKGWEVSHHDETADVAVIWSVLWNGRMAANQKIYERFKRKNKPVIILEIGCLDRGNLWKVSIGGVNGSGYFGPKENNDQRRKKLNLKIKPWKQDRNIILCGQHTSSEQWKGMPSINTWFDDVITTIRSQTDRRIIVRSHPRLFHAPSKSFKKITISQPIKIPGTYDSFNFEDQLTSAWAVINWNSNPATIAALNGVPVFVGPDSMAAPIGNFDLTKIENPVMPDREQWANDLAYTEWTLEEIAGGEPLDRLLPKILV